jgi:hypothetical protein
MNIQPLAVTTNLMTTFYEGAFVPTIMAVRGAWAGIAAGDAEGPVWGRERSSEPGTKR